MIYSCFKMTIFLMSGVIVCMQHNQRLQDVLQNFPTDGHSLRTHIEARGIQLPRRSFERHGRFLWRCRENNIFVQRAFGQGYVLYNNTHGNRAMVHLISTTHRGVEVVERAGLDQTALQDYINTLIDFEQMGY